MKCIVSISGILPALVTLGDCEADRMSEKGFSLPEGHALDGQTAFIYRHCCECHTIDGVDLPPVISIISPSHKLARGYPIETISEDARSKMPLYNGYMTVQELIDIVSFLQPHFEVIVPQYHYRVYP